MNQEPTKYYWLYVLLLEGGMYYVGITSGKTADRRIQQHLNGFYSAQWVKKYSPLATELIIDLGYVSKEQAEAFENE